MSVSLCVCLCVFVCVCVCLSVSSCLCVFVCVLREVISWRRPSTKYRQQRRSSGSAPIGLRPIAARLLIGNSTNHRLEPHVQRQCKDKAKTMQRQGKDVAKTMQRQCKDNSKTIGNSTNHIGDDLIHMCKQYKDNEARVFLLFSDSLIVAKRCIFSPPWSPWRL